MILYRKFKDRIERNSFAGTGGWIIGGGGGQRVCWPPLSNYWGAWPPWPPSAYAYESSADAEIFFFFESIAKVIDWRCGCVWRCVPDVTPVSVAMYSSSRTKVIRS